MSWLFMDSFDTYNTRDDLAQRWDAWLSYVGIVSGRAGGKAVNDWTAKYLPVSTVYVVGAAIQWSYGDLITVGFPASFPFSWSLKLTLSATDEGRLWVTDGTRSSQASEQPLITAGEWYYVEFRATNFGMGGMSGEVRINGEYVYAGSFLRGGTWPMGFGCALIWGTHDDVYAYGGVNFLGDMRHAILRPDGSGSSSQWLPSDGSSPTYQMVDDETLNTQDYAYGENLEDLDLWTLPDVPFNAEIRGVKLRLVAGARMGETSKIVPAVLASGEVCEGPPIDLDQNWATYDWDLALNPATGYPFGAWEVNEMQIGARRAV
jgi:hypothetical protein